MEFAGKVLTKWAEIHKSNNPSLWHDHVVSCGLTFFSRTGDGFWTLGLDGSTGGSEERGAFCQRMNLLADWLQKDFILTGEQQALQADKALLDQTKTGNYHYVTFSPCMMADSQNAGSKIIIIIIIKSRYIANKATVCSPIKCPKQNTENLFMSGITCL